MAKKRHVSEWFDEEEWAALTEKSRQCVEYLIAKGQENRPINRAAADLIILCHERGQSHFAVIYSAVATILSTGDVSDLLGILNSLAIECSPPQDPSRN